jgi:hypothetical protein
MYTRTLYMNERYRFINDFYHVLYIFKFVGAMFMRVQYCQAHTRKRTEPNGH